MFQKYPTHMKNFTGSLKRTILYLLYYIYVSKHSTTINAVSYILFRTSCIFFQYVHHWSWPFVTQFLICPPMIMILCHTVFNMATTDTDLSYVTQCSTCPQLTLTLCQFSVCPPLTLTIYWNELNISIFHLTKRTTCIEKDISRCPAQNIFKIIRWL
jgi:hypothetical protein